MSLTVDSQRWTCYLQYSTILRLIQPTTARTTKFRLLRRTWPAKAVGRALMNEKCSALWRAHWTLSQAARPYFQSRRSFT